MRRRIWLLVVLALLASAVVLALTRVRIGSSGELTVERLAEPVPVSAPEHADFWTALGDLDTEYAGPDRVPDGQQDALARALARFLDRDFEGTVAAAESLRREATDPVVLAYALDLQLYSLFAPGEWRRYLAVAPDPAAMAAGDTTVMADPSNYALVKGWALPPPEEITWLADHMVLPIKRNLADHVLVPVEVNGVSKWFVVDTGAALTVVSSRLARELGVSPLTQETGDLGTSTDIRVAAAPVVIDQLRLGDLTFRNHRALCLDEADLEFKLLFVPLFRIDGILGWNAIEQIRLELDLDTGEAIVTRPFEPGPGMERNLVWVGEEGPLVHLTTGQGTPVWFHLDTGANHSRLFTDIRRKLDLTTAGDTRFAVRGGAGGVQTAQEEQIEAFSLIHCGHRYGFERIALEARHRETGPHGAPEDWVRIDGVLGMDVIARGRVLIDPQMGRFEIHPPDEQTDPVRPM